MAVTAYLPSSTLQQPGPGLEAHQGPGHELVGPVTLSSRTHLRTKDAHTATKAPRGGLKKLTPEHAKKGRAATVSGSDDRAGSGYPRDSQAPGTPSRSKDRCDDPEAMECGQADPQMNIVVSGQTASAAPWGLAFLKPNLRNQLLS